ncbi:MAG: response regulator [Spirulinaceae cyanobacterium SM2_1_0]|nr:response regulator [Spirulinaceae cyanobacterium SM2_1_0]
MTEAPEQSSLGNVLLVDDTPNNLRVLSTLLSKKGYEVRSVISGEMALRAAKASPPDLVLLDINMPRMNGYEVCQALKADETTRDIPVIFISALSEVLDKVKAFAAGGVDYITKPFQFAEVLVRVENQLNLRNLQRMLEEQNEQLIKEVSDRQVAETALQASETELRALFAAMSDTIAVFDRDGTCLKIAPTRSTVHWPASTTVQTIDDLFPPEQATQHRDCIQQVLAQRTAQTVEYFLQVNGADRWFSANVSPLSDTAVIWVARDVTESKRAQQALRYQQERSEHLLLNILPEPIARRLKDEESTIADSFDNVTVIFADLVNFTEFSTQISSTELVEVLNTIFSEFDYVAARHGLEKIKTIGDAYMAVAGLPTPRSDHANAVARMALDLLDFIKEFSTQTGENFSLRIGINSGSVVAGVIGVSKFGYDLWGDTVNVASRMESQGTPGKIQVTANTYDLLKTDYEFEERGEVEVKGKGRMKTYWLLKQKS